MINYMNTLNLPDTNFPMRGNLVKTEPITLQRWNKQDLYKIIRQSKKGKKLFVLHDGPPYANGNIHIGHAINKILKDIIIKSKGLMGYDSPYVPGWDCHGLPIELKVEKIINKLNNKVSSAEFRNICRHYAFEQLEKQKNDFIRLGILGDWKRPYMTMDFNTEANIIRIFGKVISNGHVYKSIKPVYWCISCQSSLAEAEVEYYNRTSPSIYVIFLIKNTSTIISKFNLVNFSGQVSIITWTTTPWTLPANRAIAVHPDFDYQLIKVCNRAYILAAKLVSSTMTRIGITNWTILGSVKGYVLEFLQLNHPFMDFDVPIILSQHVTLNTGTGIVHTAPGHGLDDYIIGQKYGLEIANPVGPDGCYLPDTLPLLDGLQVFKANNLIINLLRDNNTLLHINNIQHSYPHCWRHKTPIIFRATPQWFISMDKYNLRKRALAEIKNVKLNPSWSQEHIKVMIANRPDWCISRQRTWGVPMSLFIHNKTELLHPRTIELIELIAKRVEKNGIQAWWDLDITEILGDEAINYNKVTDTLDIWFDSGSTHSSVIAERPEFKDYISDIYLEGSDQHRGWFMSSLIISIAVNGKAPYRQVLTHGFSVDEQGRKMSKSVGNIINPQQIISKFGADILRLWVASTDYTEEMKISNKILKQSIDSYRRIRNTARFLLANLNDFDPLYYRVSPEKMIELDRWAVSQAKAVQDAIIIAYNNYDFHNVIKRIIYFCSVEMGSFYLDIIKDRQYTTQTNSLARRSCQTAMYHIIEALVRWVAPIISFTADEIWNFIPGKERTQYVFTEEWYNGLFEIDDTRSFNNNFWKTIFQVRNEINKIIEQARVDKRIGSSLEVKIILYAKSNLATLLRKLNNELYFVLLTSKAIVKDYNDASYDAIQCENIKELKIVLAKAEGKKCLRCWHYEIHINQNINYPGICSRCITNIIGPGEERKFV